MNTAETFLGGGTDFKQPLDEAIQLMDTGFENAVSAGRESPY